MKLIELNEIIEGRYTKKLDKPKEFVNITKEDFDEFMRVLTVDNMYKMSLMLTESSNEFYKAFSFVKKSIDPAKQEDLFYAAKLGFFFDGVPTKLTYILYKALTTHDTPNNAISSIDQRLWQKYTSEGTLPEGLTIKRVIENLLGDSFDTLLSYRRKTKWKDCYEIYVEDIDRVLVVPESIGDKIESRDDLLNVHYVKDKGVYVYDTLIRTMDERVGITLDEFDLRGCI